jgi:hypothetical protein
MKLFNDIMLILRKIVMKGPVKEGGRNPYVDWVAILLISLVLTILLVLNGVNLFFRINTIEVKTDKPSTGVVADIFDEKVLEEVINNFENRASLSDNARKSYKTLPDPSI